MSEIDQRITRARRASEVLENPLYVEAWQAVESEIYKRWKDSPVGDVEGQHELRLMHHVLQSVKAQFDSIVRDGQMAQAEKVGLLKQLKNRFHL